MITLRQSFVIFLGAIGAVSTAHAANGVIRFHGAVVEHATCTSKIKPDGSRLSVECDAERARAAGLPVDGAMRSARHVWVMTLPARGASDKPGAKPPVVVLTYR